MRVRATAVGFQGNVLRKVGDVFDVPEGRTASWFEPVEVDLEAVQPKRGRPRKSEGKASTPEGEET